MNGAALLHAAGALVERGWCQGAESRDVHGVPVDVTDPQAQAWSLLGALQAASIADGETALSDIAVAVAMIAELIDDPSLSNWNDVTARTRSDVVGLLARAESNAAAYTGLPAAT